MAFSTGYEKSGRFSPVTRYFVVSVISFLALRAFTSDNLSMKGIEFIKRIRLLAKQRGVEVSLDKKRGKGSHVTLYFNGKRTIVRNPKDELKTGTFAAMLKQLGLEKDEI